MLVKKDDTDEDMKAPLQLRPIHKTFTSHEIQLRNLRYSPHL